MSLLPLLLAAACVHGQDAHETIERSARRDQNNFLLARQYTFLQHATVRSLDGKGNVKKTEQETHEILILFGEPYQRLIEKDGRPLSPGDARKEQEKLDKFTAGRARESEEKRRKRVAEQEKKRQKELAFMREIVNAYTFSIAGSEAIDGRDCWIIDAVPRPEFKGKDMQARMLNKFRGRLWVDKSEYHWTRVEAEAIDTVSFGLILARLAKGTRMQFEQTRINDEVWLPKRIKVNAEARLALLKKMNADIDIVYDKYRKFQSESRIVSTGDPSEDGLSEIQPGSAK